MPPLFGLVSCLRRFLLGGMLAIVATAAAQSPLGEPLLPVWFPDSETNSLLDYSAATDPVAPYTVGSIAKAGRTSTPALKANASARSGEGRVMILSSNGTAASETRTIGGFSNRAHAYTFTNWQYIDSYVYWGGSAGEGNILTPPTGLIDAAHRNGVPIYGTIFFPPNAFGGNIDRVNEMLQQRRDGSFPVADRLIEIAETNGFDGFFVNQETNGGNAATATKMREFMQYYQSQSAGTNKELIWYDAMIESGPVIWQEQLNSQNDSFFQFGGEVVSERMFLDFGWRQTNLDTSNSNAAALGRSPYDLYAGINMALGTSQFTNAAMALPAGSPHRTSLGLFGPTASLNAAAGATPEAQIKDFHRLESELWVGANGDPSDTSGIVGSGDWRGVAHHVAASTPAVGDVFVTNFNLGQGVGYYIDGERLSTEDWNHLGVQDVLPTWRWIVDSPAANPLQPGFDFGDAYYGGASLNVSGDLNAENTVRLYMADIQLHNDSNFQIAVKTGAAEATHAEVVLAFSDDPTNFTVAIPIGDTTTDGWDLKTLDLGDHAGKTVSQIGLRFNDADDPEYSINIGRLGIIRGLADEIAPATNPRIDQAFVDNGSVNLRVRWDHSTDYKRTTDNEVYYYNLYRRNADGTRSFLGGTSGNAYFVSGLDIDVSEESVILEVEAVGNEFGTSPLATLKYD